MEKVAAAEAPEVLWESEYKEFTTHPLYRHFSKIIESIYEYHGKTATVTRYSQRFEIPKELLAFAHANELINFSEDNDRISLTVKGKFFVKKFTSEKG